ncbi:putative MATH/TRAF domain, BTB/Kelch-associated [Helianthus annuus]|nr:putative MATH/TRAF domain, BTB/Kelch-associated [Helianthus annuus]
MTPESVLVYLDLPSTILESQAFQPLTIAAKQFYAVHYKDITRFRKATLGLPLASVEAILASDDLQLKSENAVYCFVLDWALAHYPDYKERRDIIATRLAKFIRFPYMTRRMLAEVLTCPEFNPEFAQKVVKEALSFKSEVPTMEHTYIRDEYSILNCWFVERAYKARPIKMVEYEQPIPHCVVYFDLKRDMCASLSPSGMVKSEAFNLGSHRDHWFCLVARCNTDCFGLYLGMLDADQRPLSVHFAFEYEFAAMSKRTNEFVSRRKGLCTFSYKWAIGIHNMFAIPWTSFIGEDSVYFVDGVLHLRAELTQLS